MTHALFYLTLAATILGLAFLSTLPRGRWFGLPIWYVGLGYLLFRFAPGLTPLQPEYNDEQSFGIEIATELIVIISLAVAGLAIDTKPGWKRWSPTGRLLLITMPLCIGAVAFLGWWWCGLLVPGAVLLGAAIAPTDPVLAQSVQVNPPGHGDASRVRFGLTAEAGMNDGLAFPFVYLSLALATKGATWEAFGYWFFVDLIVRVAIGVIIGAGVGYLISHLIFRHTDETERDLPNEGVVVVAGIFASYGLAELCQGYGFLAVFSAAIAARRIDPDHRYHLHSHQFATHLEDVLLALMLLGFGGLLASGVLWSITWIDVAFALTFLFIVRPAAGMIGLLGHQLPIYDRLTISWLGIRGIGSIYYLAYATNQYEFYQRDRLWAIVSLIILISIVLHAVTAVPMLEHLCSKDGDDTKVQLGAPRAESE